VQEFGVFAVPATYVPGPAPACRQLD
jgi:hypothetical protein